MLRRDEMRHALVEWIKSEGLPSAGIGLLGEALSEVCESPCLVADPATKREWTNATDVVLQTWSDIQGNEQCEQPCRFPDAMAD